MFLFISFQPSSWGDQFMALLHSYEFGQSITILNMTSLTEERLRHTKPLSDVDLVLLFNGRDHYSFAGMSFTCRFVQF